MRAQSTHLEAGVQAAPLHAEVVIIGAGIAGSLLALELGRQGLDVAVVDLHAVYPSDFRCEKFTRDQLALLADLDALDCLERAELDHRPPALPGQPSPAKGLADRGMRYDLMVNAVRGEWPAGVRFIEGRVEEIGPGEELQRLVLTTGEVLTARLIVLASGPNEKLRSRLGVARQMLRERQSVCIGFSIAPKAGTSFPFSSLVHQGERPGDGVAFASLFPMAGAMRVNLFVYHDPRDAWTRAFREDPLGQLFEALPGLRPILGDAQVVAPVELRATDLYQSDGHLISGVVLIGDAFRSSCPATGMGVTRAMTDVRQLARVHIREWLETPGMGPEKIAAFYADPVKQAVDGASTRKAETGRRSATETGLRWRVRRRLGRVVRAARGVAASLSPARVAESRS